MEYTCPSTNRTETWDGWAPHLELPVKQDFGLGTQQHFNNKVNKDMVNFTGIESDIQAPRTTLTGLLQDHRTSNVSLVALSPEKSRDSNTS